MAGWRPTRLGLAVDVGRHLTWLFGQPLSRLLDETRADLLISLADPVEDWTDLVGNHTLRAGVWSFSGGVCFVAGLGTIAVQRYVPDASWVLRAAFGVCAATAFPHAMAALYANRRARGRSALPAGGPRAMLLRPGNRYFLVVLALAGALWWMVR